MEVELFTILPIIFPSLLLIWMGTLYLRKKSIVISYGVFWGFLIVMFLLMFITQIIGAYQNHLEFEKEWEEDIGTENSSPSEFNLFIHLFPIIMIMPIFLIFYFLFKNAILIYNIRDEDLSNNLSNALKKLNWKYDRDFTYIHVNNPKIKIKVGMADPMRMCQIFFKDVEDKGIINEFIMTLKNEISGNTVQPFLPMGLLYILIGIFIFIFPFIMIAMI